MEPLAKQEPPVDAAPEAGLILVAEDNPVLAAAVCALAANVPGLEGAVAQHMPLSRLREAARRGPRIIILDPAQYGGGPEAVVAALRAPADAGAHEQPPPRLIAYSSDERPETARRCLALGFRAYVVKTAEAGTLAQAMGVVAQGGTCLNRDLGAALFASKVPAALGGEDDLTAQETLVLRFLAWGYPNRQIAQGLGLAPRSVDTLRSRAMRKIGASDRAALVRAAIERGWYAPPAGDHDGALSGFFPTGPASCPAVGHGLPD